MPLVQNKELNNTIKVSIIIVNWNGEHFLYDCFRSLKTQTFKNFEIIFVDNGSNDNSVLVSKKLSIDLGLPLKSVILSANKGFTGGNIEGLKHCSGEYIALLNNDTIATKRWLEALTMAMDSHPELGICASKLIVAGENVIDSAGDGYSTFGRAFKRGEGNPPHDFSIKEYVFGACAGAALYRRRMLNEIGFFDDDFFILFEDADINFRAQLSGWKCLYVPEAVVYHKVGGTLKNHGGAESYYAVRNDKLVKIKNIPLSIIFCKMPFLILGGIIEFLYYIRIKRLRHYLRANRDVFKSLSVFLKKRHKLMKFKKVPDSYINSLLTSGFKLYGLKRIRRYISM